MSTAVLERPEVKLTSRYSGEFKCAIAADLASFDADGVYVQFVEPLPKKTLFIDSDYSKIERRMSEIASVEAIAEEFKMITWPSKSQMVESLRNTLKERESSPIGRPPSRPDWWPLPYTDMRSRDEVIQYTNQRYQAMLSEMPGTPQDHEHCCPQCQCPAHLMPYLPCVPGAYTPSKQQVMNSLGNITGPLTV